MYLKRLSDKASKSFGLELDRNRALAAREHGYVVIAAGEALPLPANRFDLILSHEVLEHVQDDRLSLKEMVRALRRPDPEAGIAGGRLLIFVPNRGYPFETHGIYWREKYYFGNIPLVNYLPDSLRNPLTPHVRVYRKADLLKLVDFQELKLIEHRILFGAYDNVIARFPRLGRSLRGFLQSLEHTPLRSLGLSHFLILERA
jgi:SAM-dependent methyltransferase